MNAASDVIPTEWGGGCYSNMMIVIECNTDINTSSTMFCGNTANYEAVLICVDINDIAATTI